MLRIDPSRRGGINETHGNFWELRNKSKIAAKLEKTSETLENHPSLLSAYARDYITNDAPFAFLGTVSIRLLNVLSGASAFVKENLGSSANGLHKV